jgi:aryl-alcohol dehydrogenase-like predicted oxidoreductase
MCDERCLICVVGFLTGAYKSAEDFEEGDMRRFNPRFQGEAFKENLKLVDALK